MTAKKRRKSPQVRKLAELRDPRNFYGRWLDYAFYLYLVRAGAT